MNKLYLDVTVEFDKNGQIRPLSFDWEDEKVIIERVSNMIELERTAKENVIHRYTCFTQGKEFYLCFDSFRWYIEMK